MRGAEGVRHLGGGSLPLARAVLPSSLLSGWSLRVFAVFTPENLPAGRTLRVSPSAAIGARYGLDVGGTRGRTRSGAAATTHLCSPRRRCKDLPQVESTTSPSDDRPLHRRRHHPLAKKARTPTLPPSPAAPSHPHAELSAPPSWAIVIAASRSPTTAMRMSLCFRLTLSRRTCVA